MLRNIVILIIGFAMLITFSCSTDNTTNTVTNTVTNTGKFSDLEVPDGFDWDFTNEVEVNITTVDSDGSPVGGKTVSLYKTADNLAFSMTTNAIGILKTAITLPESKQDVILECDGEQFTVPVTGNSIDYQMVVSPSGGRSNSGYVYVPGNNSELTYMFEDNWPNKGDYDFNDLVVETWSVLRYQYDYLRWIEVYVKVVAAGATFNNGFAIAYDSDALPNNVDDTVIFSAYDVDGNPLPMTSEEVHTAYGTDVFWYNYEQIQFHFFTNVFDVLPLPQGCLTSNTNKDHPWIEPVILKIRIDYGTSAPPYYDPSAPCFNLNALNPYININGETGHEIHLPGEGYTDAFNQQSLFGTGDDNTPETGMADPLYENNGFTTIEGYPWGLKLEGILEYPSEKSDVIQAYPELQDYFDGTQNIFDNWWQPHPDPDYSEGYIFDRQDMTVEDQNTPL